MKKISFGSFPFINIDKKTRLCLDKYLIKTFADQIIITDIFSNLNTAKDFFYLTPDIIIDQLYDFRNEKIRNRNKYPAVYTRGIRENEITPISSKTRLIIDNENFFYESNIKIIEEASGGAGIKVKDPYIDILKRGFFILRNFYKKVYNDPFYRDVVYLPVYSEKLEVLNPIKITNSQFKYSFFLLADDLTKGLKLDEVSFNESAVINALYIFTQLFPGKKLTEFNEKDLEKLLRMYKFFEEYNFSPIQFFTILYRLFYAFANAKNLEEAKQAMISASKKPPFNQIFNDNVIKAVFETMVSFNKKELAEAIDFLRIFNNKINIELNRENQERFWKVLEAILNNKNVMSLIQNVSDSYSERLKIVNQNFKFRDIIILFEELVNYNKKGTNDIIKDTNFNLNFKLELNNETVAFNEQIIKKKLDETFANFLDDANKYIKELFNKKVERINDYKGNNALFQVALSREKVDKDVERYHRLERQLRDIHMQMMQVRERDPDEYARLQLAYNDLSREMASLTPHINNNIISMNIMQTANDDLNKRYANAYNQDLLRISERMREIENDLNNSDSLSDMERHNLNLELNSLQNEYNDILQRQREFNAAADSSGSNKLEFKNSESLDLESAKTELGELYQTLKNFLMNQDLFNIFIKISETNPEIFTPDGFKNFINKKNYQNDSEERLAIEFKDIDLALKDVSEILSERFLQMLEAQIANVHEYRGNESFFEKIRENIKHSLLKFQNLEELIKSRFLRILCMRVCRIFATTFKRNLEKSEISFNETTYGIHPMIKNLLKYPNNFKSLIFGFDELNNLYDLLYITEMEKYLMQSASNLSFTGAQRVPIKMTQIVNRFNHVIDILGIKENPLWIISKSKIFLSLPDFMSLTKDRIFNSIRKEDIQNYCRIDYGKIWNELDFGSAFGNKEQRYRKKINDIEKKLNNLRKEMEKIQKDIQKAGKNKNLKDKLNKELKKLKAEEDYLLTSLKALQSTMSLFGLQKDNLKLNTVQDVF